MKTKQDLSIKELVEAMARALADNPGQVSVNEIPGQQVTIFELRVARSDMAKVIGKQGKNAEAMRTILGAAGMKLRKRFALEIIE